MDFSKSRVGHETMRGGIMEAQVELTIEAEV